jgi:uncharacterized membrane protein YdjX (TVP38/TMEM64 family)
MSNRLIKTSFAVIWFGLAIAAGVAWFRSGLALRDVPDQLNEWLSLFGVGRAAAIYIVLYTLRPLILFPASLLTIASGLIFGPWLGILFTIIGENASANFAFLISRWLGRSWIDEREQGRLKSWDQKIRENAISSVLIMRLIYLPFDAVNYGCGLTSMRQRDFFLGTLLGIMPGLVSFVLLGGAGASGVENRLWIFGGACFFFVFGLLIARALRKKEPTEGLADTGTTR